jgi:hypothetical protein
VLANTSGFVYYVSITGITGSASADSAAVGEAVAASSGIPNCRSRRLRHQDAGAARAIAQNADGAVVGTALVDALRASLDAEGRATAKPSRRWPIWCAPGAGRAGRQTGRGISHNCSEIGVRAACRGPQPPYVAAIGDKRSPVLDAL